MTEKFADRTAGIWVPLAFYVIGGVYMLAFWGVFSLSDLHLAIFGVVSLVIAIALFMLSRWGFWLGLFTFPLFVTEFVLALVASVGFVGWYPNLQTGALQTSMIVYLIFLVFSLILLIDKRNTLKTDRVLDRLHGPVAPAAEDKQSKP